MAQARPHFVNDYRRFVGRLLVGGLDRDEAMAKAVGGDFEGVGAREREVLLALGLKEGDYVIDAGCGSGRLATALHRHGPAIEYLGTDVVPELLGYARERCPNSRWRFEAVEGLLIPEETGRADFVVLFSLLTHLTRREGDVYLEEAKRVLNSGGKIVVSYIDPVESPAWLTLRVTISRLLRSLFHHSFLSVITTRGVMRQRALTLDMEVQFLGPLVGQSVCIFSHPPGNPDL